MRRLKRKRITFLLAFLAVLALTITACGGGGSQPSDPSTSQDGGTPSTGDGGSPSGGAAAGEPIRIGATVPITGPLSLSGQSYYNSLRMAQEDINNAGGINGRPLEIVFEDTQDSNAVAVNAFNKLLHEIDPPFIFLSSYSTQNLAIEPLVAEAGIPVMYAGGADAVAEQGNPWMFRIRPSDNTIARAMVQFGIESLGATKPGIAYIQNDYGQGGALALEEILNEIGVPPVAKESHSETDTDLSAQLLNFKNAGADVIFLFPYPHDNALFMQQRKQLGIDIPIIGPTTMYLPAVLELVTPEELENTYGVEPGVVRGNPDPRVQEWAARYREKFGVDADAYSTAYYDGAMIVAEGLRQVGEDREKLREYIANVAGYEGLQGVYDFDEKGNGLHGAVAVTMKPGTKDPEILEIIDLR